MSPFHIIRWERRIFFEAYAGCPGEAGKRLSTVGVQQFSFEMSSLAAVRMMKKMGSPSWIHRASGKTSSALAFLWPQVGVSVQSEDRHAA